MENPDLRDRNSDWSLRATLNALAIGLDAPGSPKMTFTEMWHNGAKRLLLVLIGISGVILLVVGGVAAGIFYVTIRIDKIDTKVVAVSDKQGEIIGQVVDNTESITNLSESVNEGWKTFQKANPTQPVPQISDAPIPDGKTEVVVKPPISKPKPTATPKTRTVIKYKSRSKPTPAPFFRWKK